MLNDIRKFARRAASLDDGERRTLGTFLREESFGQEFRDHYIVPMASALWSAAPGVVLRFPISALLEFFRRHGLLRLDERLEWQTIPGGSDRYVAALTEQLEGRIHLNMPVEQVRRNGRGVSIRAANTEVTYDHVVIATHADQALRLLHRPSDTERQLLSQWEYSVNDTWLHSDERMLPRREAARSAWNYTVPDCRAPEKRVSATYGLNRLQRLDSETEYMVTLNPDSEPAQEHTIARMRCRHPMMTPESTATWHDLPDLNGRGRTWFCGSYFGYGFHEDGARSAVAVASALGAAGP